MSHTEKCTLAQKMYLVRLIVEHGKGVLNINGEVYFSSFAFGKIPTHKVQLCNAL